MRLSETAAEVMRSSEYMEAQDHIRSKIRQKLGETALEMVWAKRFAVSEAIDIQRSKQESRYETDEDRTRKFLQIMPHWLNAQYKLDKHNTIKSLKMQPQTLLPTIPQSVIITPCNYSNIS